MRKGSGAVGRCLAKMGHGMATWGPLPPPILANPYLHRSLRLWTPCHRVCCYSILTIVMLFCLTARGATSGGEMGAMARSRVMDDLRGFLVGINATECRSFQCLSTRMSGCPGFNLETFSSSFSLASNRCY